MSSSSVYFWLLIISMIATISLIFMLFKKTNKSQLKLVFSFTLFCLLICLIGQISQILFSNKYNIKPIYFDYFVYVGTCFLPVFIFLTGKILLNTKIKFTRKYLLLFIVPLISLIILWTNDFHHLFYKYYSINLVDCIVGPYMIIHNLYSYFILFLGIFYMLKSATKSSGFFSKQSILIILGISIPVVVNVLGTLKIIPMTIYITPITFTFALAFIALAIFKFNFLGIAPITLQTIVNRISDSYIILNEDYVVTDFNATFLKTFNTTESIIRNKNIIHILSNDVTYGIDTKKLVALLSKVKDSKEMFSQEFSVTKLDKYFTVEINSLYNKDSFLGILILFKDITQHIKDMQALKDNQDILMEKERLATLGQMIGGVAHNLKTPIMSISGATEGLEDLVKEYEESVGDPDVTINDHHAIAKDMRDWITKIRSYDSYMSDIITAVKGQAVNMNEDTHEAFTIDELLSRVNILMKHELKESLITMNEDIQIDRKTKILGNVNSLVQVVNNLIANSIQSYGAPKTFETQSLPSSANGSSFIKGNGSDLGSSKAIGQEISDIVGERIIVLIIYKKDDNIIISVQDHGCGIPDEVQKKLFKEMITTKGHNGSGLGMFMSYSTIKGNFHGDITFSSKVGKGTTFNIVLPRK